MRAVDDSDIVSPDLTGKPAEIGADREGDSVILAVSGEVDLATADSLDVAIRQVEETETERIVVDLSDLSFLDSCGLMVLVRASVRHREDGNRLSFIPSKHEGVIQLLAITGTGEMFE
jgi:anti-sigma B factor antagonist